MSAALPAILYLCAAASAGAGSLGVRDAIGFGDAVSLVQAQRTLGGGHIYHMHIPRTAGTSFRDDANVILLKHLDLFNIVDLTSKEGCFKWRDTLAGPVLWVATMLRDPRAHVLSQYMLCSEGTIALMTSVPKGRGGFRSWVHSWTDLQKEGKVVGDLSAADGKDLTKDEQYLLLSAIPFKCYNPFNLQSHHFTCEHPYKFPPRIDAELAIQNMQKTQFVGIQEAYHESVCLFAAKATNRLPEHCNCTDRELWNSFRPGRASSHMRRTRTDRNMSHYKPEVLEEVDNLTALDRALYKAGVERFVREIHETEERFSVKIMCDSSLLSKRSLQVPSPPGATSSLWSRVHADLRRDL